jgi:hypothetical protein
MVLDERVLNFAARLRLLPSRVERWPAVFLGEFPGSASAPGGLVEAKPAPVSLERRHDRLVLDMDDLHAGLRSFS